MTRPRFRDIPRIRRTLHAAAAALAAVLALALGHGCDAPDVAATLPRARARDFNRPTHLPAGVVAGQLQAFEDPEGALTIDQAVRSDGFLAVLVKSPNFHFSRSAYWLRLPLENELDRPIRLFLDIEHPTLDDVTLHVVSPTRTHPVEHTGDRVPMQLRPMRSTSLILPFDLDAGESVDLYLRVRSDAGALMIPIDVLDQGELLRTLLRQRLIHGIMFGTFLTLFIYNLLVFALLREMSYFFYVAYLASCYLAIIALDGFGTLVLSPDHTWLANEGLIVFSGMSFVLVLLFIRSFLHTWEHPRLDSSIRALIVACLVLVLSPSIMPIGCAYRLEMGILFAFPLVSLAIGVVTWRRGRTEARFFVLGQAASWVGLVLFGAMLADFLPYNLVLFEAISLGVTVDALLLALALADRIRLLQRAKRQAQEEARRTLEMRQEELERMVAQRTSELEMARKQAELLATTDPLTGVFNRRGLMERAERDLQLAIRAGRPLSIVIFDIDHFKRVNDAHGHLEGDRVLCAVAAAVKRVLRGTDLFGRIGGEEFLLVMPDTPGELAVQIAERIRLVIADEVRSGPAAQSVTASFGVSCVTERRDDLDRLQSTADAALYRAKHNGRNRVEVADIAVADELHASPYYLL